MAPGKPHTRHSVSVVIPTYNRLCTLKRAVKSVLEQTYAVLEIIVIDDGSTDGTADWLSKQDKPVLSILQGNHGVSHARNRGIRAAKGNWIALLDSDDYWHKDKLQKQIAAVENFPQLRLCHCDEIWIRNNKRVNPKYKHRKLGGNIFEHCLALCAISPSASMLRADLFADYGLFDESLPACEDYDLWLRITAREPVCYINEALLTKTGGHADQLSAHFPIMDRFRLRSLAKLLRSQSLDSAQRQLAQEKFNEKWHIVHNGAHKHANVALIKELTSDYADLIGAMALDQQ